MKKLILTILFMGCACSVALAQEQAQLLNALKPFVQNIEASQPIPTVSPSEEGAIGSLKKLSFAAEMFAVSHNGKYPTTVEDITGDQFDANIGLCRGTDGHYRYECDWTSEKYELKAIALDNDLRSFTITNGGIVTQLLKE